MSVKSDETILIQRCKDDEPGAFDELVSIYEHQVYNFAYRISGSYDDALDVTQEAFIRVFNSLRTFRGDANFTTWMYRIVKNVYLDLRKKSKSHRLVSLDESIELDENSVMRQFEDEKPTPEQLIEIKERNQILHEAVASLPDYQKIIVTLYHVHHKSYEEIAEIMDLPIGTVKSRLNRARLALSEILKSNPELFT